jgi:hypothetical protein
MNKNMTARYSINRSTKHKHNIQNNIQNNKQQTTHQTHQTQLKSDQQQIKHHNNKRTKQHNKSDEHNIQIVQNNKQQTTNNYLEPFSHRDCDRHARHVGLVLLRTNGAADAFHLGTRKLLETTIKTNNTTQT